MDIIIILIIAGLFFLFTVKIPDQRNQKTLALILWCLYLLYTASIRLKMYFCCVNKLKYNYIEDSHISLPNVITYILYGL